MLSKSLILRTASLRPVESTVRRSRLFKPLVSRFIAGDALPEALAASQVLLAKGFLVTLDHLGENTLTSEAAEAAAKSYAEMLDAIAQVDRVQDYAANSPPSETYEPYGPCGPYEPFAPEPLNISIKLTQCGLDLGDGIAEANYRKVVEQAALSRNFVRIDMEASAYTQRTIDIVSRVMEEHPNTGTVLQSYLYRTDEDVDLMIRLQARVRLVKGAYLEPKEVAYTDKRKVDEAFLEQSKRLLREGFYPAIATHDEGVVAALKIYAEKAQIPRKSYEFQMLYGIRRDLQESLREEGYNVRVYVPFGDQWYPYFTRRLAERPANTLFILKSLFKG